MGTQWRLIELPDADLPADVDVTVAFEVGGRVSGTSGCNRFGGTFTVDGELLTILDVGSTLMSCGSDLDEMEGAFLRHLSATERWAITDGQLRLEGRSGGAPLVFRAVGDSGPSGGAGPLVGPVWTLTELEGAAIPADAGVTATFAADGSVSGSGGCNEYGGRYSVEGDLLMVDSIVSTEIGCDAPVLAREQAFFEALSSSAGFRIDGDRLELLDRDGVVLAVFRDVPRQR